MDREQIAWGRLQELAPRGRYEHTRTLARRNGHRSSFLRRVDRTPGGCWLWTGPVQQGKSAKYTLFFFRAIEPPHPARNRSAFVWMMQEWFPETEVSDKHRTMATCGNDLCINPHHRRDMKLTRAFLTPDQVIEIFNAQGRVAAIDLAAQYGISQSGVSNIWTGKRWSDVTGAKYKPKAQKPKVHIPDEIVNMIRAQQGIRSTRSVARDFNVSQASVARIWRGERRASLPQEQGA